MFSLPYYFVVDCGEPIAPANGTMWILNGTTYLAEVKFECDPGFELIGNASNVCSLSGQWEPGTPTCQFIGSLYYMLHYYCYYYCWFSLFWRFCRSCSCSSWCSRNCNYCCNCCSVFRRLQCKYWLRVDENCMHLLRFGRSLCRFKTNWCYPKSLSRWRWWCHKCNGAISFWFIRLSL